MNSYTPKTKAEEKRVAEWLIAEKIGFTIASELKIGAGPGTFMLNPIHSFAPDLLAIVTALLESGCAPILEPKAKLILRAIQEATPPSLP